MKKQLLFLTIMLSVLVGLSNSANAQWTFATYTTSDAYALMVVGADLFVTGKGGIFKLSNNGGTATEMNTGTGIGGNDYAWALAQSGSTLYASSDFGVFKSTNNGSSWTSAGLSNGEGLFVQSLAISGTSIFAGTWNGGTYRSMDDGASWTQVTTSNARDLVVIGNNIFIATGYSGIKRSTDNGDNWSALTGVTETGTWTLIANDTTLYAGGNSRVYISTDKGDNWSTINNSTFGGFTALAVIDTNVFAANNNTVYLSSDGNWTDLNTGMNYDEINTLAIYGAYLYVGASVGAVWKRPLSEMGVAGIIESETNKNMAIFPNPSSGKFTLNTTEKINSIVIYNIIGKVVYQSQNPQSEIDLCRQPNGIYFLEVKSGEKTYNQKIVKD